MKKLIFVCLLVLSVSSSVFAELKSHKSVNFINANYRGTYYMMKASFDEGKTSIDKNAIPDLIVTQSTIFSLTINSEISIYGILEVVDENGILHNWIFFNDNEGNRDKENWWIITSPASGMVLIQMMRHLENDTNKEVGRFLYLLNLK
jgi:hypothetical protein